VIKSILYSAAGVALLAIALVLPGCEVGHPFRGPGYDSAKGVVGPGAGRTLVVAITQGDIAPGSRGRFDAQLRNVLAGMNEHDGLVGYSVRKQLFGRRVWTMSVWLDEASLYQFIDSPAHRAAVAEGGIPRSSFVYLRADLPADQIPLSWDRAKRMMAASQVTKESR
jgi:quinol monooxygenase YgiN